MSEADPNKASQQPEDSRGKKWPVIAGIAALAGAAGLAVVGLKVADNKSNRGDVPSTTPSTEAAAETTTTVPKDEFFPYPFSGGYTIDCVATTETVKPGDTTFDLSVEGLDPSSFGYNYVYDATRIYNLEHGIDPDNIRPNQRIFILKDCILSSPDLSQPGGVEGIYTKWYQSNDSYYRYSGETNELLYCEPMPQCEQNPPGE